MNKLVTVTLMGLTLSAGTFVSTNADAAEMNHNQHQDGSRRVPYSQPLDFRSGQQHWMNNGTQQTNSVQQNNTGTISTSTSTTTTLTSTTSTSTSSTSTSSTSTSSINSNAAGYSWPLDDEFNIFDGFGYSSWRGGQHYGIDISSATINGKAVHAVKAGTVEYAGWEDGGGGNAVIINHGNGVKSVYYHLSAITVAAGDKVSTGDQIGNVGTTGNSTGPHLHLEIRVNGTPVNPLNYISSK